MKDKTKTNKAKNEKKDFGGISATGILKNMKRLLCLWLGTTVAVSVLSVTVMGLVKLDSHKNTSSVISLTYNGVERGVDPNGNKFNINVLKDEKVISKSLAELNLEQSADDIRRCISFEGIIPTNAIDRITAYKNIFDDKALDSNVDQITDSTYYPTQYIVKFDYASTGLKANEATELLNKILESYNDSFIDAYGSNEALFESFKSIEYTDYDYAEALDIFDSTLNKLSSYIGQVASKDTTRFRSSVTDCTFADITSTIATIRDVDFDKISSYVTINSITKDKESLLTYYQFKVESLQRQQVIYQERLASVNDSIAKYEKNKVMVFGAAGNNTMDTNASEASAEYDSLFNQRNDIQSSLSSTVQSINLYNKRIERLTASTAINTAEQKAKVEEMLSNLNNQINSLVDISEKTTDDFYRNEVYSSAYNILSPATSSSVIKNAIKDSKMLVVEIDALIFVLWLAAAVVLSCNEEIKKSRESGIIELKAAESKE